MTDWQPIETAPKAMMLILYFPPLGGKNALNEMIRVDRYPVGYPRQPSHWMPLPLPPNAPSSG